MQLRKLALASIKVYEWLLILYPQPFRNEYEHQLVQTFRDSLRNVDTNVEMVRFWLSSLWDVLGNAGIERLKQLTGLRWLPEGLRFISGFAAFVVSAGLFFWTTWGVTVFLVTAWDGSTPPEGTLAGAINNFFETSTYISQSLAYVVTGLNLIAFLKIMRGRRYKLSTIFLRFTAIHLATSIVSIALSLAVMWIGEMLYPVDLGFLRRGVIHVYSGLIISASLILFFARQALLTPYPMWFKPNRAPLPQVER